MLPRSEALEYGQWQNNEEKLEQSYYSYLYVQDFYDHFQGVFLQIQKFVPFQDYHNEDYNGLNQEGSDIQFCVDQQNSLLLKCDVLLQKELFFWYIY